MMHDGTSGHSDRMVGRESGTIPWVLIVAGINDPVIASMSGRICFFALPLDSSEIPRHFTNSAYIV
jgi:hypothetical protein